MFEFIDLRKNSGEERRRAHDLFPALWICDLFMKRVQANEFWTLFDPYQCPELTELYGEEFEAKYLEYEQMDNILKHRVVAKDLWKKILTNYFESGLPFLCFKDNANRANPNGHAGIIRSSNLCTEIFQNTNPNHYVVEVEFDDGSKVIYDEKQEVELDSGVRKAANKITSVDSLQGKKVFITTRIAQGGDTAVCNLASVNLSKIHSAIGLGVMGEAEMLACAKIEWGSDEHLAKIDEVMELISFYAISSSSDLAQEKGKYPQFDGSNWSKGIMPIDLANKEALKIVDRGGLFSQQCDWESLRKKVKTQGIRNGYLMAIAPTSSISILVGTTQTIEPVYRKKWLEENLSGMIPVLLSLGSFGIKRSLISFSSSDFLDSSSFSSSLASSPSSLSSSKALLSAMPSSTEK